MITVSSPLFGTVSVLGETKAVVPWIERLPPLIATPAAESGPRF